MISCLPSISNAVQAIRDGDLEARELVEYCLDRIDREEPHLFAWEAVDSEGARREASRLDDLRREGRILGPLHGIPIGIKDIIDVRGFPTTSGSPVSSREPVDRDATVVTRLREAGAVVLGKTVTTEFACFQPAKTRNPWNPRHTPGGSSSGSAVAVATEMCMGALGSQTGGSIIRPASYCGVVGFKPTRGRVPLQGVMPVSVSLDQLGPLARSVDDAAQMWAALSTPASDEPRSARADLAQQDWLDKDSSREPPEYRPIDEFFAAAATSECLAAVRGALAAFCDGDPSSLPLPPSFSSVHEHHRTIMYVEAADVHQELLAEHREQYSTQLATMLDEGLATQAVRYLRARRHQSEFGEQLQEILGTPLRVAVMPATPATAPSLETTGDPAFNSPWTYAGVPAITIPCGLDERGLPIGLQLITAAGCDDWLLQVAASCEQRLDLQMKPPLHHGASEDRNA